MEVVQKQATVIVGSNKYAGRTNMKYITWLLLFFVLSCVFVTARNAQLTKGDHYETLQGRTDGTLRGQSLGLGHG
jgi:hypothetical protein